MKPALVVMAAGMGSRYGGLKQIEGVGPHGEIVLDYSVFDAIRAGFGRVVFVIRKDIEETFRAVIEPRLKGRIDVDYVYQELDALPAPYKVPAGRTKPWGTGHAILVCSETVREPFGVINADDFYGRDSFQALADSLRRRQPTDPVFTLVGFRLGNTLSEHGHVSRGVCSLDASGHLAGIVEHTKIEKKDGKILADKGAHTAELTADTIVSMNMWGFTPKLFPTLAQDFESFLATRGTDPKAEYYLPTHIDKLIVDKSVKVEVAISPNSWLGMTYPDDRPAVGAGIQALLNAGIYKSPLW